MKEIDLQDSKALRSLTAGEAVGLSGILFTARDAAHKRLFNALNSGDKMPIELNNATLFYVGPIFDKDGKAVSAGPTTAMRMDAYAPTLYSGGVAASIGKGDRSKAVYDAIRSNDAVYLAAVGGAGALYGEAIVSAAECVAYPELGTEAIYKLSVKNFPVIVAIDAQGNTIFGR